MKQIIWVALAWFALVETTQAASFDCAKAQSKVEHLICDNPEISKLDNELNTSYKAALQDQSKSEAIKRAQKKWMKERNGCNDATCVQNVYLKRNEQLRVSARAKETDDFKKFDLANEDAQPLVAYIQTTDWPDALEHITSYQKLSENKFLYVVSFPLIGAGIYIADIEKNIQDKIIPGAVSIERLDAGIKDKKYYLVHSGGGTHGEGWGAYTILQISELANFTVQKIFDYSYDMVSGLCGRRELGIDKAVEVTSHEFVQDPAPGKVTFSVIEENCHSGEKRSVRRSFSIDSNNSITHHSNGTPNGAH